MIEPFQIHAVKVRCSTQYRENGEWIRCAELVEIQGYQHTWSKCARGHEIRCPDIFCWQPQKCITAQKCKGLRACND